MSIDPADPRVKEIVTVGIREAWLAGYEAARKQAINKAVDALWDLMQHRCLWDVPLVNAVTGAIQSMQPEAQP